MGSKAVDFYGNQEYSEQQVEWIGVQDSLKKRMILGDDFDWKLPPGIDPPHKSVENQDAASGGILRYVGGVDLSFSKIDSSIACATLVVLELRNFEVLYEDSAIVDLHVPYVPGFLAFREAPVLLELLEKMRKKAFSFYPQLLMVDGNGLLHPRGFGLASHIGVLSNLPTIGIGKNLHHVDGLMQSKVREMLETQENSRKKVVPLIGASGSTLGAAIRSTQGSTKPIFVSVGHRVSLSTGIEVVSMACKFRIPEPIRQADIRSRQCLRKHGST